MVLVEVVSIRRRVRVEAVTHRAVADLEEKIRLLPRTLVVAELGGQGEKVEHQNV